LKTGDQVLSINTKSTKGITLPEAVNLMRGAVGTPIELVILPKGEAKEKRVSLKRESIRMQSVRSIRLPGDLAYLRVSQFIERTSDELSGVIDKLNREKKIQGLILDLRGNPGGLLDQAQTFLRRKSTRLSRSDFL
jgi:carboxyl-terminal processing protease